MKKVFCAPLLEDRYDCHIKIADMVKAIETFGQGLYRLTLNPVYLNEKGKFFLEFDYPENVEVVSCPGCGAWEIWGDVREILPEKENIGATDVLNPPDKKQNGKDLISTPLASPEHLGKADTPKILHYTKSPKLEAGKMCSNNVAKIEKQEQIFLQHGRGRPRKTGDDVSRWTKYRRQKEEQGVLL